MALGRILETNSSFSNFFQSQKLHYSNLINLLYFREVVCPEQVAQVVRLPTYPSTCPTTLLPRLTAAQQNVKKMSSSKRFVSSTSIRAKAATFPVTSRTVPLKYGKIPSARFGPALTSQRLQSPGPPWHQPPLWAPTPAFQTLRVQHRPLSMYFL